MPDTCFLIFHYVLLSVLCFLLGFGIGNKRAYEQKGDELVLTKAENKELREQITILKAQKAPTIIEMKSNGLQADLDKFIFEVLKRIKITQGGP